MALGMHLGAKSNLERSGKLDRCKAIVRAGEKFQNGIFHASVGGLRLRRDNCGRATRLSPKKLSIFSFKIRQLSINVDQGFLPESAKLVQIRNLAQQTPGLLANLRVRSWIWHFRSRTAFLKLDQQRARTLISALWHGELSGSIRMSRQAWEGSPRDCLQIPAGSGRFREPQ